jgi:cysteine desulfurase
LKTSNYWRENLVGRGYHRKTPILFRLQRPFISNSQIGILGPDSMDSIFLDNNSTTMLDDGVIRSMEECQKGRFANPASQHEFGRSARRALERARDSLATHLNLRVDDQCLFTSGGTEANNLGLFGFFPPESRNAGFNLVSTSIEHPSLLAAYDWLSLQGVEIRLIDPDNLGRVDAESLLELADSQTRWVGCMAGNNETGVLQPIERIAAGCERLNLPFHVDAVQAVGKILFDFSLPGISSAAISAHKIHGPVGIGALLVKKDIPVSPMLFGGFQQGGIRPGTENLVLATGFATAIENAIGQLEDHQLHLSTLRDDLEHRLLNAIPEVVVNGSTQFRLPHTTNLSFLGIDRQQFILAADTQKIAVSTGSACSSGSSQASHVLTAMNCPKENIDSAIRFGLSIQNKTEEIQQASARIAQICANLRSGKLKGGNSH